MPVNWISARKIHEFYLDVIKECSSGSYNENAVKPFEELTGEQRKIDYYIVNKINEFIDNLIEVREMRGDTDGI